MNGMQQDDLARDVAVYGGLAIATTAYAALLERYAKRHRIEPDMTWLEVVIGNGLCLAAAAIRERLGPGDGRGYERRVWRAFVWGGLPIIGWQLWQARRRYQEACAEQSSKHLAASAKLLAEAIAAIQRGNPVQAELLITRARLENAQADALQERIRRVLEVARHGRV